MNSGFSRPFAIRSSAHSILIKTLAVLVGLYLVSVLPYSFPPHTRLVSPSYVFGFNNRVAILSFIGLTLLLTGLDLSSPGAIVRVLVNKTRGSFWYPNRTLAWTYLAVALSYLALTLVIYFTVAKSGGFYKFDWESSHFVWRTRLMNLYGLQPYRDFLVEYGPAFVYLPAWAAAVLQPLGVSTEAAYYILHYSLNLAGLAALLYVIDAFSVSLRVKATAFVLIAISAFSEMMGLNGLLIRFILPYACLLVVYRASVRAAEQKTVWRLSLAVAVSSAANFALSPDVGVAWLAGVCVYAALVFRIDRRLAAQIFLSETAVIAISPLILPTAYFRTLLSFSQGANNFPIVPALHIVFYLFVFLLCVPRLLLTGLRERDFPGAYTGGMGALCLAALPAALGRCDPPHVILNGFGLFTVAFATFAQDRPRRLLTYGALYIAVAIVAFQYSNARVYGMSLSYIRSGASRIYAVLERLGGRRRPTADGQPDRTRSGSQLEHPDSQPYARYERYPSLALPYGSYGYEKSLQRYLWSKKKVAPERYMGAVGIYDEHQLAERLRNLAQNRHIVVQKYFLKLFENRDPCRELQRYLKLSFLYFKAPPCIHDVFDPDIEMARFIYGRYRVVDQIGDYLILESKS